MDRNQLLDSGWRRHSIFTGTSDLGKNITSELPEKICTLIKVANSIVIVTTYDCAVVNNCFDSEPWLQIVIAIPAEFRKEYSNGRNPRKIHFEVKKDDHIQNYEATAVGICQIDRSHLLSHIPNNKFQLPDISKTDLKLWLCERFRQETWPNAFNSAINPSRKKIKKFWAKYNHFSSAVYIKLNTYEELEGSKYKIAIIIAIESPPKLRELIKKIRKQKGNAAKPIDEVKSVITNELKTAFGDCVKFEDDITNSLGVAIEIMTENEITLDIVRNFSKFSPYSLSVADDNSMLPVDVLPR